MKKTRWIILLFVFIFAGIQTGCARSNPFIEKEESEASSDSEAQSEETTPEESETSSQEEASSEESQETSSEEGQEASEEESTEPAEEDPIRQLFCLKDAGYIRKIRSYADGSLVVCTGILPDDPDSGEGFKDSGLYEIDPARDEILQKASMEGKDIELLAVRNNGELFITKA